ncbi:DUF1778 domain-containing protein [Pleurocapsales cyanobacterium LEGE 06147]|nr:DUF1778 domain-containing protein [Pleurocapsales cyanobacterium LEGE 06147]
MAKSTNNSSARLEARVNPEVKALWQKAAELEGRTLTDFVIASVQEAAFKVIQRHQILKLNREDSETFVATLLEPPQFNEALKTAAVSYKQKIKS